MKNHAPPFLFMQRPYSNVFVPIETTNQHLLNVFRETVFDNVYIYRLTLYQVLENTLSNLGLKGKACLLRFICETFQLPLPNIGFLGEFLEIFLR